jgi:hypothetical protein
LSEPEPYIGCSALEEEEEKEKEKEEEKEKEGGEGGGEGEGGGGGGEGGEEEEEEDDDDDEEEEEEEEEASKNINLCLSLHYSMNQARLDLTGLHSVCVPALFNIRSHSGIARACLIGKLIESVNSLTSVIFNIQLATPLDSHLWTRLHGRRLNIDGGPHSFKDKKRQYTLFRLHSFIYSFQ